MSPDTSSSSPSGLLNRLVKIARSPWIIPWLFLLEVAETTFLPLPYEAAFIALCLAARERIWLFLTITVLGSAVAGAVMYGLGAYYSEPLANYLGIESLLASVTAAFEERGGSYIFLGGTTPAPSYIINLAAGASGYPFATFLTLFTASRFLRFAVIGLLLYLFGDQITKGWQALPPRLRNLGLILLLAGLIWWFASGFIAN